MTLSRTLLAVAIFGCASAAPVAAQQPWSGLPVDLQISLALQAAPEEMRDDATVQGYNREGTFVILRQGGNDLFCMAPDPNRESFEVSCHHGALEPFFERGRELIAEGITGQDRVQARWDEFTAGTLPIPSGSVNYILAGSGFNPGTGEVTDPYLRWTVYMPNATSESTGMSQAPSAGGPWLMFPGTPGAHIMITPPRNSGR